MSPIELTKPAHGGVKTKNFAGLERSKLTSYSAKHKQLIAAVFDALLPSSLQALVLSQEAQGLAARRWRSRLLCATKKLSSSRRRCASRRTALQYKHGDMDIAMEWIRAGEQPGGQDLSKWGRNGRIEAQRALAAAQVTPMATQKEAGRGKSI